MSDDDGLSPLEKLTAAAQEFINSLQDDGAVLMRGAVLSWEQVRFDDAGAALYRVDYASLPETSPAGTIGLLELCRFKAVRDMGGFTPDDDGDEP